MESIRLRFFAVFTFTVLVSASTLAQDAPENKEEKKPDPISAAKIASGNLTGEQIAELSIAIYGYPGGRATLNQIRKTAVERGKVSITNGEGKVDNANYQRWFLRPETGAEKTRIDQQFPNVRFSLINRDGEIFGIFNDASFIPRDDASNAFQNQLYHSIDAYLRYKENESTVAVGGREKILGVDYHLVDMTDKQGRKTRYFVSVKSFRVMMLEYESGGVTYKRKFYDYRYAQGTLFPFRSVLLSGDRTLEEVHVGTITFGQKVDEGLFEKPQA